MGTVEANGITIRYALSGRKDAPCVVLSHSLGSSLSMWEPQMACMEEDFRVLRYDTRGHGGTDAPEGPYSLEQLGEDVIGLLDRLGVERAHWVGLSMGGMIGQALALTHPRRLISLALCDTAAALPDDAQPVWEERIQRARRGGMQALMEETLSRWFTAPFLHRNPPGVGRIREEFLSTPVAGFIGCGEAIRRLNFLHRLSQIRVPTLIVVGAEDPGTPVSAAQAMQERIPGSRLIVIPSAAHLSNVEQPEAFNQAVGGFLRAQG
jgi:3-oxoadipate enol-lactonase